MEKFRFSVPGRISNSSTIKHARVLYFVVQESEVIIVHLLGSFTAYGFGTLYLWSQVPTHQHFLLPSFFVHSFVEVSLFLFYSYVK